MNKNINLLRQYKLYLLDIDIEPMSKEIIKFIENKLFNLKAVRIKNFPFEIFYFNKGHEFIFSHKDNSSIAIIRNDNFYEILANKYVFFNYELNNGYVIISIINKNFNLKLEKMNVQFKGADTSIEYQYKMENNIYW